MISNSPVTAQNFTANPTSLTFAFQPGGQVPAPQSVQIAGAQGLQFTAQVIVDSPPAPPNVQWLTINGNLPSITLPAGSSFNVTVAPIGLANGTYTGRILVNLSTGGGTPLTIPVTLTVQGALQLGVSPQTLTFNYQTGTPPPATQNVTLTNSGTAPIQFTTIVNTTAGPTGWLQVGLNSGVVTNANPVVLPVAINVAGLAASTTPYTGTITINSNASNSPVAIQVSVNVSANPVVNITPGQLVFSYQTGGTAPASQILLLNNFGNGVQFTAAPDANTPWLTVAPQTGTSPAAVIVTANPANLNPGTYSSNVVITANTAANTATKVPVTLVVSSTPLVTATPNTFQFAYQTGGSQPPTQTIQVNSTGGPGNQQAYTVAASAANGLNWLVVNPLSGTTPGAITVSTNTAGLSAGVYNGNITVTGTAAGNVPQNIAVTLTVSAKPLLTTSLSALQFSSNGGAQPDNQTIPLGSTGGAINYTAAATSSPTSWLLVGPPSGTTGSTNLTVGVNPAGLAAGTYSGLVTVTAQGVDNSPLVFPVTLTVTPTVANLIVTPASLTFTQGQGTAPPPTQTLSVTSSGGILAFSDQISYTGTATGWLSVSPTGGITPASSVIVSINQNSLPTGTYFAIVNFTATGAANNPQSVIVQLNVTNAVTLAASPTTISATGSTGGPNPGNLTVNITSAGAPVPFTVTSATQTGGSQWLTVTPASGTTPGTLTFAFNTSGLQPGTYTGNVVVTPQGGAPLTIPVTLTINQNPKPVVSKIVNAASFIPGSVAPGEIVTLGGTNIGPATLAGLTLTPAGTVSTSVANTQVFFDGIPAPIVYVRNDQTSVVVPYEVAGRFTTSIQVSLNGVLSDPIVQRVDPSAPGIFALNSQGSGQGIVVNQDNTINGPSNPANKNDIVVIYATGEGQTSPAGVTGAVSAPPFRKPLSAVSVLIGGVAVPPENIAYAGAAPGLVAGVMQINVKIPASAPSGTSVPLAVQVGSAASQSGVTLSIR